jgi:hypothetical protein
MSSSLGPIEIICDAPPYSIVRASRTLGFLSPEDVRWCRMSHYRAERDSLWELLNPVTWKQALGGSVRTRRAYTCVCNQDLPAMERYLFTFGTGRQEAYLLGQCRHCRTIFWEEA